MPALVLTPRCDGNSTPGKEKVTNKLVRNNIHIYQFSSFFVCIKCISELDIHIQTMLLDEDSI